MKTLGFMGVYDGSDDDMELVDEETDIHLESGSQRTQASLELLSMLKSSSSEWESLLQKNKKVLDDE